MMAAVTVIRGNSGMSGDTCHIHAIDREPMNHGFMMLKWHVAAAASLLLYTHDSNADPRSASRSL